MKLSKIATDGLIELIENAKYSDVVSELSREVMADFYKKPKEKITLTDLVAFGWEVTDELSKRLRYEKD
jgi:hypothetical protein